ncbi:hypothetical protein [Acrocarpospora pleiomorpha]|uniref:hypothetical protein n=1 Tax=Acrocarpospora pleiomorpha TaxID=90975 RepID=UPI0012D327EE|nr:hypothetical protein [Acrocarpospora pleiomorpha]
MLLVLEVRLHAEQSGDLPDLLREDHIVGHCVEQARTLDLRIADNGSGSLGPGKKRLRFPCQLVDLDESVAVRAMKGVRPALSQEPGNEAVNDGQVLISGQRGVQHEVNGVAHMLTLYCEYVVDPARNAPEVSGLDQINDTSHGKTGDYDENDARASSTRLVRDTG